MDFSFTEEQEAVSLARQIVDGQLSHEQLQEHRASGEPFPAKAWQELAKAGLVGIGLPEDVGGGGPASSRCTWCSSRSDGLRLPCPTWPPCSWALPLARLE